MSSDVKHSDPLQAQAGEYRVSVDVHLPDTMPGFRNIHKGSTIIVCGCGESVSGFDDPERFITIGVNDVGRLFQPDYLVVVNHRHQFRKDRFEHIENSRARALFSHLRLDVGHPKQIRFALGRRGGMEVDDPTSLPYTRNSPYIATCLALFMGAQRVGLIGVDFTDRHFFGALGTHPLTRELRQIDMEYGRLAETWRARGVSIVNLSPVSRLQSLPRASLDDLRRDGPSRTISTPAPASTDRAMPAAAGGLKLFFVHYRFLSAGDVFTHGLTEAARTLGVNAEHTYWDDPRLEQRIAACDPDLVLVVHGRRFSRRRIRLPERAKTAVWLVDEPYEVDDTASWSGRFDAVFLNDFTTLARHRNAHYLPVAFDPSRHTDNGGERRHMVGFIGGYNPDREAMLLRLLDEGMLSYVVGGPWRSPRLKAISRSGNIPAAETAELYRQTRIVINIFRSQHHFNRAKTPGHAMNPRVYEALACGALVVSEHRPEIETVFPAMPVFRGPDELVAVMRRLLRDEEAFATALAACRAALPGHSYADRLKTIISAFAGAGAEPMPVVPSLAVLPTLPAGWGSTAGLILHNQPDQALALRLPHALPPGAEEGLASLDRFGPIRLSCMIEPGAGARVILKLHQQDRLDQTTNSYHMVLEQGQGYVATHNKVLHRFSCLAQGAVAVTLEWNGGLLRGTVGGQALPELQARQLTEGYCFIGLNRGTAVVRDLEMVAPPPAHTVPAPSAPSSEIRLCRGIDTPVEGCVRLDDGAALASLMRFTDVDVTMTVSLEPQASLVVKLHLQDSQDAATNSYHAIFRPDRAYLARHNRILASLPAPLGTNRRLGFRRFADRLQLTLDGRCVAQVRDSLLACGHVTITAEDGAAILSDLTLTPLDQAAAAALVAAGTGRSRMAQAHASAAPVTPFSTTPTRNLIYHIWPVRNSVWRWNLQQLLERIELFNGRRIIGIVSDDHSDEPEAVQAMLEGHGCEFIQRPNRPTGEVETFPAMLDAVRSDSRNEVTFYGHAKGVKYREAVSPAVRRWTEALYRTVLDDWGGVRTALNRHVFAGSFRRVGRVGPHRYLGSWHYSGTFFWMRNSFVSNLSRLRVTKFYSGVETWPGQHFPLHLAACLFLDRLSQVPYDPMFWANCGERALREWEEVDRDVAPPPELFGTLSADGHRGPSLGWRPEALDWLLQRIENQGARRVLSFGTLHGGLEWHLARRARERGRTLEMTVVAPDGSEELERTLAMAASEFRHTIRMLRLPPEDPMLRRELQPGFGTAVLDGTPGYRRARAAFGLAHALGARSIAVNAITDSDWHAYRGVCHSRLWAEIAPTAHSQCYGTEDWGGVGFIEV
ncbi:CgeB family protein [Azospirillum sp. B2RO_4]|uniref:CgeB family protein n=1 Tax=Azospirillum sp. B2RO_4 TaxID=3027796 RepID=UPI003DA8FBBE